ncbi:putative DNA polymerase sliding clamp [Powai lake megavirus]|uniref:Putative DNA polymerase sliding clamp n=1 Tax=Powai lake megavirus TaxID=1842663 RepID=A0A167RBL1_9VIRU|nr:putative DNA polymerase sliding clamp [Powai lake megavirus]ANB50504.1 putative DNA polymerase sliding clamp [Powai lake megavirus]
MSKVQNKTQKKVSKTSKDAVQETKSVKTDLKKPSVKSDKKDNKILEIRTTQTGALKQVIERISNVISDCCIVFIPPDNKQNDDNDDNDDDNDDGNESGNESDNNESDNESDNSESDNDSSDESDEDSHKRSRSKSKSKKKKIQKKESKKKISKKQPKSDQSKKKNQGGIRILRLTEDKSILIKLVLNADNFDYFRCDEPKITIGVDMHTLHGLLKMINDDDPMMLYMIEGCRSSLYIRSLNEDKDNSEETDIELFLMEIPNPEMPVPVTKFQNRITMKSDKFHNICKHLNNNSTFVEIKSINNEIIFVGQNEGGKVTMSCRDTEYNSAGKDTNQVVQGMYELRNLLGFSKCNKLCNTIELYLKNDFPLVLVISVATLGKMYVFLSPIENGNN